MKMRPESWMLTFFLLINICSLLSFARNLPWAKSHEYTKYHPMDVILRWMEDMERGNPEVVSSAAYGQTVEGRDIRLLKLGLHNSKGREKKAIWIDCGIHAREWIAPAFCQWFVKEIVTNYKSDKKLGQILKDIDIFVTPVLNVDGYVFTWANESTRLWRKSRSPPPPGSDCYGVDLNRNFNVNWGMVDSSPDSCSNTYMGTSAGSEPEVKAVMDFVGKMKEQTLAFFSIHSYMQLIVLPYGHPEVAAPNAQELRFVGEAAASAIKKVHGMTYSVGNPAEHLYPFSGSGQDWARIMGIPLSFTIELRDKGKQGFLLPEEQIQPTCEEAYAGVLSIITYAHHKNVLKAQLIQADH